MSRRRVSALGKVRIHTAPGSDDERGATRVHYQSVPGQSYVSTLCGWDGGGRRDRGPDVDSEPVECKDCIAIYTFFRGAK